MKKYDLIVVGSGPGGYVSAIKAAQLGASVAIVEKDELGGICLNWGCIPTKTMLIAAKHYKDILRAEEFGITGIDKDKIAMDWKLLLRRKDSVVSKLVSGVGMLLKKNNVDIIKGNAKAAGKNQIRVENQLFEYKNLILAMGAAANVPDIPGLKEAISSEKALTSKGMLQLEYIPKDIIILGGNTYAVEFAALFNAIGSNVTLIQDSDRILPYAEDEMAKLLERQLKKDGVKIISGSVLESVTAESVTAKVKDEVKEFKGDKYFVFLGLIPNIQGFEELGLKLNKKGFVETDARLKTNISNIYAIGDINGKYPLAHVASAEGITAAENIMGIDSKLNYNLIPSVVYSYPELTSVGFTEEQVKEKGHDYKVSKFPLSANGMAIAAGETTGFVKIISDNQYGEVIGVHIISTDASNMISKAVAIMQLEGTVYDLARTIHPHPTFSEALVEAAYGAIDKPIHM